MTNTNVAISETENSSAEVIGCAVRENCRVKEFGKYMERSLQDVALRAQSQADAQNIIAQTYKGLSGEMDKIVASFLKDVEAKTKSEQPAEPTPTDEGNAPHGEK